MPTYGIGVLVCEHPILVASSDCDKPSCRRLNSASIATGFGILWPPNCRRRVTGRSISGSRGSCPAGRKALSFN